MLEPPGRRGGVGAGRDGVREEMLLYAILGGGETVRGHQYCMPRMGEVTLMSLISRGKVVVESVA